MSLQANLLETTIGSAPQVTIKAIKESDPVRFTGATALTLFPGSLASLTASARNSAGYGGRPLGMWTPFPGTLQRSVQVSTKPGQVHNVP